MLPSRSLVTSRRHSGRRSCPASAAFVNLTRPMRSAQPGRATPARCESAASVSGRIGHQRRACKLRGDIPPKDRRSDMIETALKIRPDLSTDVGPALAESKILTEIGAGRGIDHALEQRKAVRTSRKRVMRVLAEKLQGRIVRMRAHFLKHLA